MFECKFKVHGLCQSKCLEKAADAKSRQEQFEMSLGAKVWEEKKKTGEKSYVVVKCPFKLIYSNAKEANQQFKLVRQEMNHIHRVDFGEHSEGGIKAK